MPVADVCLLVEGTYPYVSGGVSSWVHDLIRGLSEHSFEMVNVGSHPGAYGKPRYQLPGNVRNLHHVFCRDGQLPPLTGPERAELERNIRSVRRKPERESPSRVLSAISRLHFEDDVDDELCADFAAGDLDVPTFLHSQASFDLLVEMGRRLAPATSFLDLFWHYRAMHVPLLRLLTAPIPTAACYHAVSTGYAGFLGAIWGFKTGRPFVVTEHGIYSREREMELSRADWIQDEKAQNSLAAWTPAPSPLRRLWTRLFRKLAQIAYCRAAEIITLSEANREKQIADGAPPRKIRIVPNGVAPPPASSARASAERAGPDRAGAGSPLRVGFVGRVVPIKDVVTFIKACDLALRDAPLDVRIIGPDDEDPVYAKRCKGLVATLGRTTSIRFVGPMPPSSIYGDLDVVVLTSFSEGQPLVILEAYSAAIPVIATDVGACREMIEGQEGDDRYLGPSGLVTRVANPEDTARALVRLAGDADLRARYGQAGRDRVTTYYQREDMLASYEDIYRKARA
jgi:glycosyltransferase involved in cell wall biosynthesis